MYFACSVEELKAEIELQKSYYKSISNLLSEDEPTTADGSQTQLVRHSLHISEHFSKMLI